MVRYRNALSKLSDLEGGCSFNIRMHPLTYPNKNVYNDISEIKMMKNQSHKLSNEWHKMTEMFI